MDEAKAHAGDRRDGRWALLDPALTSTPPGAAGRRNLLLLDGDDHARLRAVVTDDLRTRRSRLGATALSAGLAGVLDRHRARGDEAAMDLVPVLEEWVAEAALEIVGVADPTAHDRLGRAVRATTGLLDVADGGTATWNQAIVRLAVEVERAHRPGVEIGLVDALRSAATEDRITTEQATFTTPVVLHGAYENPLNLVASLAAEILTDPHRHSSASADDLIDHVLRTRPPVHRVLRWATSEPEGIRSARAIWIELAGEGSPGIPFGHGPHRCPGVAIARTLGRLIVDEVRRWDPRPEVRDVEHHRGLVTQGVRRLIVSPP